MVEVAVRQVIFSDKIASPLTKQEIEQRTKDQNKEQEVYQIYFDSK